nr:uncharacterized protein LOC109168281 [Ipomoea batatas]
MMNSGFLDFAVNIPKLEHFEGVGFRRWQKKMKFLLAALNVAYVLSTPKPVEQEDETLEATRRRLKWENDDLAYRGHILNGMSDTLFDIYQYEESSKDLWDVLEAKYISEDASSKKFLVSELNEFKMVDNRSVMEQFHEIVRILGQIRQHGMNMDDSIAIASIIDKLPPSWKTFKKNGKGKGKAYVKCWVCNGPHFKKDFEVWKKRKAQMEGKSSGDHGQTDDSWWVDTGATRHVCKDINLYKVYKSLENGPSLYMGNDSMGVGGRRLVLAAPHAAMDDDGGNWLVRDAATVEGGGRMRISLPPLLLRLLASRSAASVGPLHPSGDVGDIRLLLLLIPVGDAGGFGFGFNQR